MLFQKEIKQLAKNICDATLIGRRKNKDSIKRAIRDFGPEIKELVELEKEFTTPESPVDKDILKKLQDPDYGPLVVNIKGKWKVKKEIGDCVRICYHPRNKPLAIEIWHECLRRGAHPFLNEQKSEKSKESILLPPLDSLAEFPKLGKAMLENTDVVIHLEPDEDPAVFAKIPNERLSIDIPVRLKSREIWDKKRIRGYLIGWPHPEMAKYYNFNLKKFEKIVFNSMKYTFVPEFDKLINQYYNIFNGTRKIRIVADDGTDLNFSIKNRHFMRDDGKLDDKDIKIGDLYNNLPAGEICIAPIENSANGTYVLPELYVRERGMTKGVIIKFKNGKVIEYSAMKNKKYLTQFLRDNDKNTRIIGEFGIGCNRKARYTGGYIIVDEKIWGTIHIAIGENVFIGGKNHATGHLDMIKDLRSCNGRVYADDKLVINKGKLITE